MPESQYLSDKRMLELFQMLKSNGKLRFFKQYCEHLDIPAQSITGIKKGTKHFTPNHIKKACIEFNANANWILGIEDNAFRAGTKSGTKN